MHEASEHGLRLLIVDDEPDFRQLVARIAKERGWRVSEAENGNRMIELLQSGHLPDLAVIDIMMPDMDGIEAIHRLCESHTDIAILLVTGQPLLFATLGAQLGERPDLNIIGSLAKPVPLNELRAHLDRFERAARG